MGGSRQLRGQFDGACLLSYNRHMAPTTLLFSPRPSRISLRLPPAAEALLADLTERIAARRTAQGPPTRTEVILLALEALDREYDTFEAREGNR